MGQVGQKAVTVVVSLEAEEVVAGSLLRGCVYLKAHKDITDSSLLQLSVSGREIACIEQKGSVHVDQALQGYGYRYSSGLQFYSLTYPICEIDGTLVQGSYEFPFEFIMPTDIPSSTKCTKPNGDYCAITYCVDVTLHRKGWMKWDVRDVVTFSVVRPVVEQPSPPMQIGPAASRVGSFGCIHRGLIFCGANVSATLLVRGHDVSITHLVLNKSATSIKSIRVSLIEHVAWKAANKKKHKRKCSYRRDIFVRVIQVSSLPPVETTLLHPVKQKRKQDQVFDEAAIFQEIRSICDERAQICGTDNSATITIPDDIRGSYLNGKFVNVWHELKVEALTAIGTSNAEIRSTVYAYRFDITPFR